MTDERILELAKKAGWDCRFTRLTDERDFNPTPLEIENIRKFVNLIIEDLGAGFSGSR